MPAAVGPYIDEAMLLWQEVSERMLPDLGSSDCALVCCQRQHGVRVLSPGLGAWALRTQGDLATTPPYNNAILQWYYGPANTVRGLK